MVILPDKPIVLLGFMGSGKTTLGKKLAASLDRTFIDLDRFIEAEENRTIPEIFRQDGEPAFRRLESDALKKILEEKDLVIAIGGGAPCSGDNLGLIKEKAISFYLKVSEPELLHRLTFSTTERPLLKGKSESEKQIFIADLLAARESYYKQADVIIESDGITPEMILLKVADWQK